MKHLFKSKIFKYLLLVLLLLLTVKLAWLAVELTLLSSHGTNHKNKVGGSSLYYRVKLSPNEAHAPKKIPAKPVKIAGSIKDIVLKAVYNSSSTTVVTVEYKRKTKILGRGDELNGFVLEGGGSNYATFTKGGKVYRVDLAKSKKSGSSSGSIKPSRATHNRTSHKPKAATPEGEITDAGDHRLVDRALITHYAKNLDDIRKNIGVVEVKEGKKLKGFKITFVKRGSPFAKLGVKRGDIIKSINGQEINSYNAAFETYKNIENVENLTLVIQRGKEEMELEYEIN